ncbi:NUDIX hydrolase [Nocardioides sp.]|uniref:NUDIX hydrolase n=1 Tax=Nocardioides sp. TaxID=35761 RepID=UPI002601E0E0|nr:NUDIX hydrolase [Nocardioides sp.]MCW2735646.1 ADP-ribose pyrophosphatase [Nocardioides sp.]
MTEGIRAAGGVVWRRGPDGPEVAVVHRPRYDDWSLPKGKLHAGELHLPAAMREIREEAGVVGAARSSVGGTEYDVDGVGKEVRWWSVRAATEHFAPNDEVDELRWLPPRAALELVHEPKPLRRWLELPLDAAVVLLVRHASAGDASTWRGPDSARPLDERGRGQADLIASVLPHFRPVRVLSASPLRCLDTVSPLAAVLGQRVVVDDRFAEASEPVDPERSLLEVAEPGEAVVVCSQGGIIPRILQALGLEPERIRARKGSVWVLTLHDGRLVQAEDDVLA